MPTPPGHETHEDPSRPLHVRVHPLVTLFIWAVGLTLLFFFWNAITSVGLMFLAACVVAAALLPLARRFPKSRRVGGGIAGIGFILAFLGAIGLVGWLISRPIRQELQQWPQLRDSINQFLAQESQRFGLEQDLTVQSLGQQVWDWITSGQSSQILAQFATGVSAVTVALALLLFGTLYLLVQPNGQLTDPVSRLLPAHRRNDFRQTVRQLEPQYRWWLIGTLISMTLVGLAAWGAYAIIGLKFAITLAIVAGFAEIVPTLGPFLAFLLALVVAATQGTYQIVGVIIAYGIIQLLESYILLPIVMREAVHLPPIITLFTIVLWTRLFGPLGLLLALPIDLTIWAILRNFFMDPPSRSTSPDTS